MKPQIVLLGNQSISLFVEEQFAILLRSASPLWRHTFGMWICARPNHRKVLKAEQSGQNSNANVIVLFSLQMGRANRMKSCCLRVLQFYKHHCNK